MMRKDMKRRKSLNYKIKFWFYRLTFRDISTGIKTVLSWMIEFVMCAIVFGLIFLVPAFFH